MITTVPSAADGQTKRPRSSFFRKQAGSLAVMPAIATAEHEQVSAHRIALQRERPAKAFSLGREADIIGRVSSRLP